MKLTFFIFSKKVLETFQTLFLAGNGLIFKVKASNSIEKIALLNLPKK
jgi:hypothetical protein